MRYAATMQLTAGVQMLLALLACGLDALHHGSKSWISGHVQAEDEGLSPCLCAKQHILGVHTVVELRHQTKKDDCVSCLLSRVPMQQDSDRGQEQLVS